MFLLRYKRYPTLRCVGVEWKWTVSGEGWEFSRGEIIDSNANVFPDLLAPLLSGHIRMIHGAFSIAGWFVYHFLRMDMAPTPLQSSITDHWSRERQTDKSPTALSVCGKGSPRPPPNKSISPWKTTAFETRTNKCLRARSHNKHAEKAVTKILT